MQVTLINESVTEIMQNLHLLGNFINASSSFLAESFQNFVGIWSKQLIRHTGDMCLLLLR